MDFILTFCIIFICVFVLPELLVLNANHPFFQKFKVIIIILSGSEDIKPGRGHRDQRPWN